jgi:hypothetical protein
MSLKMPAHGYHLVNAAITLPPTGNFLPLCRRRDASRRAAPTLFRDFPPFSEKSAASPKSFFRRAVIPFRGRKQPDGSDLMLKEGNSS